jgi:hypothetical protein
VLRRALSLALALCAVLLAESARAERLTVRSSYHQAGLVLHDLAKDADEPRALAYVRQVHARHAEKAPGLELRDARGAAKAFEATEGNCIAFTSRGRASPILRRLLEPSISWASPTFPTASPLSTYGRARGRRRVITIASCASSHRSLRCATRSTTRRPSSARSKRFTRTRWHGAPSTTTSGTRSQSSRTSGTPPARTRR